MRTTSAPAPAPTKTATAAPYVAPTVVRVYGVGTWSKTSSGCSNMTVRVEFSGGSGFRPSYLGGMDVAGWRWVSQPTTAEFVGAMNASGSFAFVGVDVFVVATATGTTHDLKTGHYLVVDPGSCTYTTN